jgi:hypothetical protein
MNAPDAQTPDFESFAQTTASEWPAKNSGVQRRPPPAAVAYREDAARRLACGVMLHQQFRRVCAHKSSVASQKLRQLTSVIDIKTPFASCAPFRTNQAISQR